MVMQPSDRKFEEKEIDPAPAAVTFSLNPRRLADYTNPFSKSSGQRYHADPGFSGANACSHGAVSDLVVPAGRLPAVEESDCGLASRSPLENSEIYLEVRERRRKMLLFACDFYRGMAGIVMMEQAVFQLTTDARWHWALDIYSSGDRACVCFAAVKSNELYAMYRKTKAIYSTENGFRFPTLMAFLPAGCSILIPIILQSSCKGQDLLH